MLERRDTDRIVPVASLRAHDSHHSLPLLSSYPLSRMLPNNFLSDKDVAISNIAGYDA